MADKNVMPRKPLDGGDGTDDNSEGKALLKAFFQWCNVVNESPEDSEEVHTKMLELLAMTKCSMNALQVKAEMIVKTQNLLHSYEKGIKSSKEKLSNIKKQLNVEKTKACSNNENPDGNKSLEQLTLTIKSVFGSLTSMYEEEEKNFSLMCKQLDGADEHVDEMQQLDKPGKKTSDNVEKK